MIAEVRVYVADLGPGMAYMTYPDGCVELNTTLDRDEQARALAAALDRFAFPEGDGHQRSDGRPRLWLLPGGVS